MAEIYFTSDTHFGHKKIIEVCHRPYDTVEGMDEGLISNWNAIVKPKDTIYHLGDVSFHKKDKTLEILKRLNGKKTLVMGNHDSSMFKNWIDGCYLFDEVVSYKEIRFNHQKICLFHFPITAWNRAHQGSWHLHGHSHGTCPPQGKRLDVGVDNYCGWAPFSVEQVAEYMGKQAFVATDYHSDGG